MARYVVKEGKLKAHKNPKVRFSCTDCGAVWDADGDDYTKESSPKNEHFCVSICGTVGCGEKVYVDITNVYTRSNTFHNIAKLRPVQLLTPHIQP